MKKFSLIFCFLIFFIAVNGQYKKLKIDTIAVNRKTATVFVDSAKFLKGINLSTVKVDIRNVSYGAGASGSIFFKRSLTGNLSSVNKFYFDSTNTRLLIGGTGLRRNPQSRLSVLADSGAIQNIAGIKEGLFNFTDPSVNKNRSTLAQATDSASFNLSKTYTGNLRLALVGKDGQERFVVDTLNSTYVNGGLNGSAFLVTSVGGGGGTSTCISIRRASGGTFSNPTNLNPYEDIGCIGFMGYRNGQYRNSSRIRTIATSSWGDADYSSDFMIETVSRGSTSLSTKFKVTSQGGQVWTPQNSKTASDSITASGGIKSSMLSHIIKFNQYNSVDITANPQIASGEDGQIIMIINISSTGTLKLNNGNGLKLAGGVSFTMGQGDVIEFVYSSNLGVWLEVTRSDN